jgi:hypothetical protein
MATLHNAHHLNAIRIRAVLRKPSSSVAGRPRGRRGVSPRCPPRGRPKAPLGEALRLRSADAVADRSWSFGTFAELGEASETTETLCEIVRAGRSATWPPKRPPEPGKIANAHVLRWIRSPSQNSSWLKHKLSWPASYSIERVLGGRHPAHHPRAARPAGVAGEAVGQALELRRGGLPAESSGRSTDHCGRNDLLTS